MPWTQGEFPHLSGTGYEITSAATRRYNCIAWAAGEERRWWWPVPAVGPGRGYWPAEAPREENLTAFQAAYATLGYQPCETGELETGYDKLAIYVDAGGVPTHAARQLADGTWTSKLGAQEDIVHTLNGLEGPAYGGVACFLCRRRGEGQ